MAYNYNIRFEQEKEEPKWPKRVQTLFDSYAQASKELSKSIGKKVSITYQPETLDFLEKIFMDRAAKKPDSLKVHIYSVYRVKNSRNEEFYFYNAVKQCKNALNQPADPFDCQYGWHKRPVFKLAWSESKEENQPRVVGYEGIFEYKWDKNEVKKLLHDSYIPCTSFYVGYAGEREPLDSAKRYYQIYNREDFLEGSFDDLYDLGRLIPQSDRDKSLQLVEGARILERKAREERAVGLTKDNKSVYA